jgi:hypothetical protein
LAQKSHDVESSDDFSSGIVPSFLLCSLITEECESGSSISAVFMRVNRVLDVPILSGKTFTRVLDSYSLTAFSKSYALYRTRRDRGLAEEVWNKVGGTAWVIQRSWHLLYRQGS